MDGEYVFSKKFRKLSANGRKQSSVMTNFQLCAFPVQRDRIQKSLKVIDSNYQ